MPFDSIPLRLRRQAKLRPDAPALSTKRGSYQPTTFAQYDALVRRAGKSLLSLGLGKASTTSILGFNREEWVVLHVATMAIGGAPAGIYTTSSAEEIAYIVGHAESPVLLVETAAQLEKARAVWPSLPKLERVVLMRGLPKPPGDERLLTWDEFLDLGRDVADERYDEALEALEPEGLATLIYTSGTTGPPKGVMLSHRNLSWTADTARAITESGPGDRALSYLPLSHIAEQVFSIHGAITSAIHVHFAESIDRVPDNLKEVQPTVFFGVPRIWEKMYAAISQRLKGAPPARRFLAEQARRVGRRASERKARGAEPTLAEALEYAAFERLVFSKLKAAIGLGSARVMVSGAAPIGKDVLDFFASFDLLVQEVYGQSEDTGPTSFNVPGRTRLGTVGPIVPGVEVRIADDGEILVRGPNVFLGYYKEPEATADTLRDGWLCSGDLGRIDDEGFLHITGRKKEILITAGGKNIAPKNIEESIKQHSLVGEAVVIGDRRKYLTALVTLEPEATAAFAKAEGLPSERLHEHPRVRAEVKKAIDAANMHLAQVETVKKFTILPQPLSIEAGELTPTLKVKRRVVAERYSNEIDAMYDERG